MTFGGVAQVSGPQVARRVSRGLHPDCNTRSEPAAATDGPPCESPPRALRQRGNPTNFAVGHER